MRTQNKREDRHFASSDIIAAAQIAAQSTHDIMAVTEALHLSILQRSGVHSHPALKVIHHTTRAIYSTVRLMPKLTSWVLHPAAKHLHRTRIQQPNPHTDSSERRKVIAALNGIAGDQLAASHNPLTSTMTFIEATPEHADNLLFCLHGLCMDEQAWDEEQLSVLAQQRNAKLVYVRYNTGLAIAENGRQLAQRLERYTHSYGGKKHAEITLVGHSMGGLVSYSALCHAEAKQLTWLANCTRLVSLGSPFHGAPLAKLGSWIDQRLASTAFTLPFSVLTKRRSRGIKDLCHGLGNGVDHGIAQPRRLPANVRHYAIAGQVTSKGHKKIDETLGDGLVTVASALALSQPENSVAFEGVNHLALLDAPQVHNQLVTWLSK